MRASTILAALIGIFIMLLMVTGALNYSFETMLFPYIIGVPIVILCIVQITREINKEPESSEGGELEKNKKSYLIASVWIAGFILMIYLLGYLFAIPLFLLLYLKLHGEKWLLSIIIAGVTTGVIYSGFVLGLKVPLHGGILIP